MSMTAAEVNGILYLGASVLTFLAAPYMVLARCYNDGLFGKCILIIASIAAFSVISEAVNTHSLPVASAADGAMVTGLALFMWRHLVNFWKWRAKEKRMTCSTKARHA